MRSPSDPIRNAWIQVLSTGGVGLLACISASLWAFSPLEHEPVDPDWQPKVDVPEPTSKSGGNLEQMVAFEKRLWTPPEKPTALAANDTPPEATPIPPPKLVLLGIVSPIESGSSGYEAILYDPDTDTVHIVSSGTAIGSVTVGSITNDTAVLVSPLGESMLRLDTGRQQADQG